jgi:hypothetical protein
MELNVKKLVQRSLDIIAIEIMATVPKLILMITDLIVVLMLHEVESWRNISTMIAIQVLTEKSYTGTVHS